MNCKTATAGNVTGSERIA